MWVLLSYQARLCFTWAFCRDEYILPTVPYAGLSLEVTALLELGLVTQEQMTVHSHPKNQIIPTLSVQG